MLGAVLCGGASTRFGRPKASAPYGEDGLLGDVPIQALRLAGIDPIVAVGGEFSAELGVPTVPDRWPGEGPLAAIASVLLYATQPHVVVSPCDLPLLEPGHIKALAIPTEPGVARVAMVDGAPQPSLGVWPTSWASRVVASLRQGERKLQTMLTFGDVLFVELPREALADADTQKELDAIEFSSDVDTSDTR